MTLESSEVGGNQTDRRIVSRRFLYFNKKLHIYIYLFVGGGGKQLITLHYCSILLGRVCCKHAFTFWNSHALSTSIIIMFAWVCLKTGHPKVPLSTISVLTKLTVWGCARHFQTHPNYNICWLWYVMILFIYIYPIISNHIPMKMCQLVWSVYSPYSYPHDWLIGWKRFGARSFDEGWHQRSVVSIASSRGTTGHPYGGLEAPAIRDGLGKSAQKLVLWLLYPLRVTFPLIC